MGARAGRGFTLAPRRPVRTKPSYLHYEPKIIPVDAAYIGVNTPAAEGSLKPPQASISFLGVHTLTMTGRLRKKGGITFTGNHLWPKEDAEGILYTTANASDAVILTIKTGGDIDRRHAVPEIDFDRTVIRTYLNVEVDFEDPAIINGRPYTPAYWAKYPFNASTAGGITVVPEPPPPVLSFPPNPKNQDSTTGWVWYASDLAKTSKLTKWKEHSGGPSWVSKNGYEPSVTDRIYFGKDGKYRTQSKVVYFDYRNVEHMWIDLGKTFKGDFTWIFAGIILNYPTARYGHYVLDHGYNTPRVSPLPGTEASAKILGDGSYRAAMLYQRNSSLQGSHTGNDLAANGKHIRIQNNYHPSPRMMYSIWNKGSSDNRGSLGTYGRRYKKTKGGTIDNKAFRRFVTGRRFNKVSKALASHMVLFEIRFFPRALTATELDRQYRNMASRYKFDRYPS
jgi:hypothetical protein